MRFYPTTRWLSLFVMLAWCLPAHAQSILYGSAYQGSLGPATLYQISKTDGTATPIGPIGFNAVGALDFAPNGTLYGVGFDGSDAVLITIDTATGTGTLVGSLKVFARVQDIAFRPSDGTLFGYVKGGGSGQVYIINTGTGMATALPNPSGTSGSGDGLAFSSAGTLYLSNTDGGSQGSLWKINQTTGVATLVAPLTFDPQFLCCGPRVNGMKFDPATGILWASVLTIGDPNFVGTINTSTGAVSFVGGTVAGLDAVALNAVQSTLLIRYFANLTTADSYIDITNSGASATANLTNQTPAQNNIDGSVCVNIYTFAADEQEVACCSCLVTPNALWSASVKTGLLNSTLTPSFPNEVVVKLISSVPTGGPGGTQTCNPASVSQGNVIGATPGSLANGLLAWGVTPHGIPTATGPTFQLAETPFLSATLSTAELVRDVQECQFIQVLGSGQFGICKGCTNAGLGANAR
jgi:hypothetical protein